MPAVRWSISDECQVRVGSKVHLCWGPAGGSGGLAIVNNGSTGHAGEGCHLGPLREVMEYSRTSSFTGSFTFSTNTSGDALMVGTVLVGC